MSIIRVNAIQGTDGVERFMARAWVNFNGTGTVAIRAAGNVSSITDNGVGYYTVNLATAMPDAKYAISAIAVDVGTAGGRTVLAFGTTPTASSFMLAVSNNTTSQDPTTVTAMVIR